jgi:hypothetical protein
MILVLRNVHICVFYFCQNFFYQARASALRRSPAPCPPLACHVLTCPLGCPQPLWAPAFHRISQAISGRFFHRKNPPRPAGQRLPRAVQCRWAALLLAQRGPALLSPGHRLPSPALGIVCPARPSAARLWAGRCWRVGTGGYRTGGRRQAGAALRGGSATDFRPRPPAGMAGAGLLLAGAGREATGPPPQPAIPRSPLPPRRQAGGAASLPVLFPGQPAPAGVALRPEQARSRPGALA